MRFTLAVAALLSTSAAVRLTQMAQAETEAEFKLDELFDAMDQNGDGAITKEEGHKAITEYAAEHKIELPEGWEKEAEALFDHVDANDDGKVTMDEVHAAIWDAVDTNDDGQW